MAIYRILMFIVVFVFFVMVMFMETRREAVGITQILEERTGTISPRESSAQLVGVGHVDKLRLFSVIVKVVNINKSNSARIHGYHRPVPPLVEFT